jgi:hypothetical protein
MSKCKYVADLRKEQKRIEKRIRVMEASTKMPQPINDEFLEKYRKLNQLRIDLKTVKSRINNYGKEGVVIYNYGFPTSDK